MKTSHINRGLLDTFQRIGILLLVISWSQWSQAAPLPQVELHTNQGIITFELEAKKAPQTVDNFLNYARTGFYNNTIIHRVIKDYMIQGGGFSADLVKKNPGSPINNEANNGFKNLKGTLVMARRGNPHSATSQFFINLKDNAILDHKNKTRRGGGYAVFGRIISGMDVLNKIANTAVAVQDKFKFLPLEPVIIEKIVITNDFKHSISTVHKPALIIEENNSDAADTEDDIADDSDAADAEEDIADDSDADSSVEEAEADTNEVSPQLLPEYSPEPPDVPAVE